MNLNKSGFLTATSSDRNAVVYYQCKSCLSFLASTSKWDRHLSKCFSKAGLNKGSAPRPVGFRMVPFYQPSLVLERITPPATLLTETTNGQLSRLVAATCEEITNVPKRRRGRPRKYFKMQESNESAKIMMKHKILNKCGVISRTASGKIVKKRGVGRPRKITPQHKLLARKEGPSTLPDSHLDVNNAIACSPKPVKKRGRPMKGLTSTQVEPLEDIGKTNESLVSFVQDENGIRKSTRTRQKSKRRYIEDFKEDEVPQKLNKYKKVKSSHGTGKRGRPRKIAVTTYPLKKGPSTFCKAAKRKFDKDKIRSYTLSCHLCPAKFQSETDHRHHVNGVHNGKIRLMECCVCGRVFNKRDSLKRHYLAHEVAEAREEAFNLFQPWDDALLKNMKANYAQQCKACLLTHYSHKSFYTHFITEHADPPEAYTLICKYEECLQQFKSIQVFLDHAMESHPKKFFGKHELSLMQKGIFIRTQRSIFVPAVDEGRKALYKVRAFPPKPVKKRVKAPPSAAGKRVSSFTHSLHNIDDDCSDKEEECGISQRQLERIERNESDMEENAEGLTSAVVAKNIVEVEPVNLDVMQFKQEPVSVKREEAVEIVMPDMIPDESSNSLESLLLEPDNESESVPVVYGIVKDDLDGPCPM